MLFKHILLTRFAILHTKSSREWLKYRIKIFEDYTLPSVKNQTTQNFDWILLANPNFPGSELIGYDNILWVDWKWDEDQKKIGPLLEEKYDCDWIITSRLDSDDVILPHFLETIQNSFRKKEEFLSIPSGYVVDLKYPLRKYARYYLRSPFISFVEKRKNLKTVLHLPHTESNPRIVSEDPGWMQLTNTGNIKNDLSKMKEKGHICE